MQTINKNIKTYYSKSFIEERKIEPAHALIVFLFGLASGLFIFGAIGILVSQEWFKKI